MANCPICNLPTVFGNHVCPTERPWEGEPDEHSFKAYGLDCKIMRNQRMKIYYGYVRVRNNHPFFGKDPMESADPNEPRDEWGTVDYEKTIDAKIKVHGGLTWSSNDHPTEEENSWWFGFDCGHAQDYVPVFHNLLFNGTEYRNFPYVFAETNKLAKQLASYIKNQCMKSKVFDNG